MVWDTTSVFDVASVLTGWTTGDALSVTVNANEFLPENVLILKSSTLELVDENSTASVPEPSTVLLLGAGVLSFVGLGRKKFKK